MLKKYQCTIIPSLDSIQFSFIKQKESIERNLKLHKVLDKWFYFFNNDPDEPVIIWLSNNVIRLEPGTMRFIGVSLRKSQMALKGILIMDEEFSHSIPNEITIGNLIETSELPFSITSGALNAQTDICKWAIRNDTSLNSTKWYGRVFGWIRKNVKNSYGLLYNNQIYYLNSKKRFIFFPPKPKLIVNVQNFTSFEDAVIYLFKQIKKYENLN